MTVIYVDTLFLLNTMVDYLLLLASARLAGEPLARLRFALGAVLGGLYAVAIFLPGMGFLARPLCRGAAAVLMVLLAFWRSRRLLRQVLIFLALACAFGGGVLAVELLGGTEAGPGGRRAVLRDGSEDRTAVGGRLLWPADPGVSGDRAARRPSGELTRVRLTLGERQVELTGLVDTGNTLTDPATGRPVLVAEADSLEELLPPGLRPGPAELRDPAGVLERLEDGPWRLRFRLLPYRAVGVEQGLLLALRMDRVQVGGRRTGGLCWPPCPPRRCPMEVLTACWWGRSDSKVKGNGDEDLERAGGAPGRTADPAGAVLPGKVMYIGGSDTLPTPLPREEEAAAIARLEQGDEEARKTLIEHNLRLVVYIARRFENTGINIEDLISIGTIGLIKAVGTYQPARSIKLATYASRCIENEILMYLRKTLSQKDGALL